MELLVVIHHPNTALRSVDHVIDDLTRVYDRAYGRTSRRFTLEQPGVLLVLLKWGRDRLGWSCWHPQDSGTLAVVGLPLLCSPIGGTSRMLNPALLAELLAGSPLQPVSQTPPHDPRAIPASRPHNDLGFCGGYFAAALADGRGCLRMATNYTGDVPLYRASNRGVTVWSNKLAAAAMLAGLPPSIDVESARELLLLWHPLGERTLWEGVHVEPPATFIDLNATGVRRQPYLDLPRAYFAHEMPVERIVSDVIEAFHPLTDGLRQADGNFRLHLTGGIDSRCVAAILRHHGFRPDTELINTPNEDHVLAPRVARALGLKHRQIPARIPAFDDFLDRARTAAWLADGSMSLKYLAGTYDLAYLRDQECTAITGLGGEFGRGNYYDTDTAFEQVAAGRFDRVHDKALLGRAEASGMPADVARIRGKIAHVMQQGLDAGLEPFRAATCDFLNQKIRRWENQRRNSGWLWYVDPLRMPCWAYRAISARPSDQAHDGLVTALTAAAWPAVSRMPTVKQAAYRARKRRVAANRITRAYYKVHDRFVTPPPNGLTQALNVLMPDLLALVRGSSPSFTRIVDPHVVAGWLTHPARNYNHVELFWHALALSVWCGTILDAPFPIRPCAT